LPHESPQELAEVREQLEEDLKPQGALERFFIDEIVSAIWRLRRAQGIETEIFMWDYYKQQVEKASREVASYEHSQFRARVEQVSTLL
jgi:hypothetical protein